MSNWVRGVGGRGGDDDGILTQVSTFNLILFFCNSNNSCQNEKKFPRLLTYDVLNNTKNVVKVIYCFYIAL
jgi:hypothetical protein